MRSQRVRQRAQRTRRTIRAAFGLAAVAAEAHRRRQLDGPGAGALANLAESVGDLFRLIGRKLGETLETLLAADDRYLRLRSALRQAQARRRLSTKRLYSRVVDVRRLLKDLLGAEGAGALLGFRGPTPREPTQLSLLADFMVERLENPHPAELPALGIPLGDTRRLAENLELLRDELDQALDDVARGRCEVTAARIAQREARAELDRVYREGARVLEESLIGAGLPTLAAAVRPRVKRQGRPRKERPVDFFPDLVEQVRSAGEVALADETEVAPAPASTRVQSVPIREVTLPAASTSALAAEAAFSKLDRASHEWPVGEEKLDRAPRKSPEGGEKVDRALGKPPGGEEKLDRAPSKPPTGEEKLDRAPRNLPEDSRTFVSTTFRLPPPIRGCDPGGARPAAGVRSSARNAGGPRSSGSVLGATLRQAREAASTWWRRARKAA